MLYLKFIYYDNISSRYGGKLCIRVKSFFGSVACEFNELDTMLGVCKKLLYFFRWICKKCDSYVIFLCISILEIVLMILIISEHMIWYSVLCIMFLSFYSQPNHYFMRNMCSFQNILVKLDALNIVEILYHRNQIFSNDLNLLV